MAISISVFILQLMKKIAKETQEEMLVADAKLGEADKSAVQTMCNGTEHENSKPKLRHSLFFGAHCYGYIQFVACLYVGNAIKDKFDIPCVYSTPAQELMRGIRSQLNSLIGEVPAKEMAAFALGMLSTISRARQPCVICYVSIQTIEFCCHVCLF